MVFPPTVYKKRRERLIKNMPEGSALILPSWPTMKYSVDLEWSYRPSSDLIYLSGFEEPASCLIILSRPQPKHILFTQKKNPEKELWTGSIHGPERASELFQMDICYPSSDFSHIAPEILKNNPSIYYAFNNSPLWDIQIQNLIQILKHKKKLFTSVHDSIYLTAPLRMKKNREEIRCIKKAVAVSTQAFKAVMKHSRPGINERELHGRFLFEIMKRGAWREAYPGIFASGPNACILHYTNNNRIIQDGDLLLIDAGAEYNFYASDITRTFPVNGKFSKVQKRLYKKLLEVQKNLIQAVKPGLFLSDIQKKAARLFVCFNKRGKSFIWIRKRYYQKTGIQKILPSFFWTFIGLRCS